MQETTSRAHETPKLKLPFLDDGPPTSSTASLQGRGAATGVRATGERPQQRRRRWLKISALIVIALPTLLAVLYYGLIAADQYAVQVRFAVRGANTPTGSDVLGLFTGLPGASSTTTDTYIVLDYIESREMVDRLESQLGLRAVYSRPEADFLARFDPDQSAEEFVRYWRSMVKASFDGASQIAWVEVRAFTAEDAKRVAEAVLQAGEQLINDLSARLRADAVTAAQQEVQRMEDRLRTNRAMVRAFRERQKEFDPVKNVEARMTILGGLEDQLAKARTKLSSLKQFMSEDAPSIVVLQSEIAALERQLRQERAKLGEGTETGTTTGSDAPLTGLVAEYQELAVEQEFSEKAYISALASLERARFEADRQQRYLAAFVRPVLPQEALYPKRLLNTLLVAGIAMLSWALGVLIAYAVRDHAM
jgi:capsular polysaccharide transport system permease protein